MSSGRGSIIRKDDRRKHDVRSRGAQAKRAFTEKGSYLLIIRIDIEMTKRFVKAFAWSVFLYADVRCEL